ncbi:MAG: phosphotransferase [Bacteroidota bacterium]
MAQYSICTAADLQRTAKKYALGQVVLSSILEGGSQNTNYLLQTDKGKFVLSIIEQRRRKEVKNLVRLLRHLRKHNFVTSKVVASTSGKYVTKYVGKPIIIKKFIKGEIIQDFPPLLMERLGATLARLHKVPSPAYLPENLDFGMEHFSQVASYAPGSAFHHWLQEQTAYFQPFLSPDLPKAIVHGDVFDNNVIVKPRKGRVVIMDFEEAAHYYRAFDIGMTIIGVCLEGQEINIGKVHQLLTGYQSELALTVAERSSLQAFVVYAATAMSFWRHRQFNYLNPTPARFEHYQALQAVANYARTLPAGVFLPDEATTVA